MGERRGFAHLVAADAEGGGGGLITVVEVPGQRLALAVAEGAARGRRGGGIGEEGRGEVGAAKG